MAEEAKESGGGQGSVFRQAGWPIVVAVIGLAVLWWGGRQLLAPREPGDEEQPDQTQTVSVGRCTDETVYTDLETALANRGGACYVDLSNQGLSELSGRVGYLTKLKMFSVQGNNLAEVPSQISYMRGLQELNLSDNQLRGIPGQVGYLEELTEVNLSGNNLTTLPVQISYWREIEELNLSDNQLTSLPEHIGYLARLRSLDLRNNQLTVLPQRIDNLHGLRRLELGGNPLPPHEIERVKQVLPRATVNFTASGGG